MPRGIAFVRATGTDLDRLALLVVNADRFKPGNRNGHLLPVCQQVEVTIEGCLVEFKDDAGKTAHKLQLKTQPLQRFEVLEGHTGGTPFFWSVSSSDGPRPLTYSIFKVGNGVSAPVPLKSVEAQYDDGARIDRVQGSCLISVIVDTNGLPQNPRVVKSLDSRLDRKAIEAVNHYRFKPARKQSGEPVPVMITVQVNFRLY
jgi:TonB family protein